MAGNPVRWFEIYVQDMARARAFYEAVLGIELTRLDPPGGDHEMWGFPVDMNAPGTSGALVAMTGAPAGPGGTVVYFTSRDCATEAGRVASCGGQLQLPKMSIGEYGFIALARDTEGNLIGFHSLA